MSIRGRLARVLMRAGVIDAALKVRAAVRAPVLTVLTYHHVADPGPDYRFDRDVADVGPDQFRRQLEALGRRFTTVGIDDVIGALDGARLPPNPLLITFDDGYRSCHDTALPILRSLGMRAVFFVASSYVAGRRLYWWERIAYTVAARRRDQVQLDYPGPLDLDLATPDATAQLIKIVKNTGGLGLDRFLGDLTRAADAAWDDAIERDLADELIMTWDQVRALADQGMDVESHTRNHRVLQTLVPSQLDDELAGSRSDLEAVLGRPVRAVAYPVGRTIARNGAIRRAVLRAGYRVGFTNASGASLIWAGTDRYDLKRWAIDRDISEPMLLGQAAVPLLGYTSPNHATAENLTA
jgi:peptidoglycan/xylan/chitin deacetylase (PgdA/CDA1 family)